MPKSMYRKKGKKSSTKKKLTRGERFSNADKKFFEKSMTKKHDMKEFDQGTDY
jgi:hypothetical protein